MQFPPLKLPLSFFDETLKTSRATPTVALSLSVCPNSHSLDTGLLLIDLGINTHQFSITVLCFLTGNNKPAHQATTSRECVCSDHCCHSRPPFCIVIDLKLDHDTRRADPSCLIHCTDIYRDDGYFLKLRTSVSTIEHGWPYRSAQSWSVGPGAKLGPFLWRNSANSQLVLPVP